MPLELTFLGTGSAFTDYRVNYHNNAVVHTGDGPVLVDCGPTARQSMRELGIDIHAVPAILVTHLHGDHVGGLEQFAWERFYTGADGAPSWSRTPVRSTPRILADLRRSLWALMDEWTDFDGAHTGGYDRLFAPTPHERDEPFAIGGVCFAFRWTPHVTGGDVDKPCFGVEVWEEARPEARFYFTSDTRFRADIGALYPQGTIFHDCTFTPPHAGSVHTHYAELCTLPDDVRARIVLMHHDRVPDGVDVVADGFAGAARRHDRFSFG